jgi:hypothetical protein
MAFLSIGLVLLFGRIGELHAKNSGFGKLECRNALLALFGAIVGVLRQIALADANAIPFIERFP